MGGRSIVQQKANYAPSVLYLGVGGGRAHLVELLPLDHTARARSLANRLLITAFGTCNYSKFGSGQSGTLAKGNYKADIYCFVPWQV